MPLNSQPDLSSIPSPVMDVAGAIPMLNTSMGLPPMFHQPQMMPGSYAVPPPQMHGGPSPFGDIFSGGRYMQNPGAVGFQQAQGIPFFQGNSVMSMGLNAIANQGLQMMGGSLPGGEALGKGMIPFGGLQTSRMNFLMMRERQDLMDQMFKGPEGLFGKNPDLEFFGTMGMASNPFAQMAVGGLTGFKTRLEAYSGNLGRAFGGDTLNQLKGGALAGIALEHSMTQAGGGLDWNLTQGLGRGQVQESITTSFRRGAFVSGRDFRDLADAMSKGDGGSEEAKRLGNKITGDVSNVMALGRDVFGQDASADDIISGIENVFGREGITDAGQAASRLREIEAAGQVLNMDSQVVAKYMQAMKQIARNAGLIGEAGTNASLGMMMSGEAANRFGNEKGINVDRNAVVSGNAVSMERNLASSDSKQKEALLNVLRTGQRDVLSGISLGTINGKQTSALQFLNDVERKMADPNLSYEERRQLEGTMEAGIKGLNSSSDPNAKVYADRLRQLSAMPQDELVNTFNELRGKTGWKEFVMGSGVNRAQMDAYENAVKRAEAQISGGSIKGGSELLKRYGGMAGLMDKVQNSGFFTALQSGDNEAAVENLGREFKGLNGEQLDSLLATVSTVMGESKRYKNETWEETMSNFASVERARKAGTVLPEFRDRERTLDVFTRIAGGLPTGGNLKARGIESIMRALNESGGLTKDKLAAIIGETTGSERVTAFSEIISGKVTAKVDGRDLSFKDLMGQVKGILGDNSLTKEERDKRAEALTSSFWKSISTSKLSGGKTVGEVMRTAREDLDAGEGKSGAPGTTGEDKDVALGNKLLETFEKMRTSDEDRFKQLMEVLQNFVKLLTPGGPKPDTP